MNRRYLVDTATREYLCVAIQKGREWEPSNQDHVENFKSSRASAQDKDVELLSGEYNDNSFFEKWIRNGTNYVFRY